MKEKSFSDARALMLSKELSKLNFNEENSELLLYTYWCRVAYSALEQWNQKEHAHSFWELHLCLSGSARILIDGTEYILDKNTYIFLSPKSKHKFLFESDDYSEFVWGFSIEDCDDVNEILFDKYRKTNVFQAETEMRNSVFMILENTEKAEFGHYHIIKNELYHIFALLVRSAGAKETKTYTKARKNEAELIGKYIRENLADSISIEDVASFFHISKSSVERICKREYNKTFSQIKMEIRAETIRKLLQETDYTMEEIAGATGFCDRYSMGKFFKKMEGETPGDYRRGTRK